MKELFLVWYSSLLIQNCFFNIELGIMIFTLLSLSVVFCALSSVSSVRFYLEPGEKRCFTQDLPTGKRINGEVQVYGSKGDMDIDVWVTTLQGKVLYHKHATSHGKLSFETPPTDEHHQHYHDEDDMDIGIQYDEDTYQLCIEHQQAPSAAHIKGTSRVINLKLFDFDSHSFQQFHYNNQHVHHQDKHKAHVLQHLGLHGTAASEVDTNRLLHSMESMSGQLSGMVTDLTKLQQNERGLMMHVRQTASRISSLAVASLVVTIVTAVLQTKYYQTYFKHKKVC